MKTSKSFYVLLIASIAFIVSAVVAFLGLIIDQESHFDRPYAFAFTLILGGFSIFLAMIFENISFLIILTIIFLPIYTYGDIILPYVNEQIGLLSVALSGGWFFIIISFIHVIKLKKGNGFYRGHKVVRKALIVMTLSYICVFTYLAIANV